jgi:hypothetical protein
MTGGGAMTPAVSLDIVEIMRRTGYDCNVEAEARIDASIPQAA